MHAPSLPWLDLQHPAHPSPQHPHIRSKYKQSEISIHVELKANISTISGAKFIKPCIVLELIASESLHVKESNLKNNQQNNTLIIQDSLLLLC